MNQTFYSNGKLLLTGEYVVLDGATALALPTKFGQDLNIASGENRIIKWTSYDYDGGVWYDDAFTFDEILSNSAPTEIRQTLFRILRSTAIANPGFFTADGYTITTRLTFPKSWGLGTSSTLINNIAQWQQIDAYQLLWNSFGGSGYDIACAQTNTPILFSLKDRKPIVSEVIFNPPFKEQLYFVYLNRKQNSKEAIHFYNAAEKPMLARSITEINKVKNSVLKADNLQEFMSALQLHENILSALLQTQTIQKQLFPDFTGVVKSLGGWGGDFVLVASESDPSAYFLGKEYRTILRYSDMIL